MEFWFILLGSILLFGFIMLNGVLMAWSPEKATAFLNWWARTAYLPKGLGRNWEVRLAGLAMVAMTGSVLFILLKAAFRKIFQV